ncbi:alpha/beta hydrolase family esterase [Actinocorallia sp. A-T 12471]|uniref:alpha/beta hydrolase family esterase n=1 Tax=Actinocorallia sp. A-T 12471 TaxID=3089813 RepID=UPI0029D1B901|nr:PHB depolymerase family esterase [Actinocorallia sp. A-T 12471]MDX6743666.1 PHB depolymerase family esterase [Actinocorallia sp. A-T 12471]
MRWFGVLVALILLMSGCTTPDDQGDPPQKTDKIPWSAGTHRERIDVDGPGWREYQLRVPPKAEGPLPLVVAVHGGASTADRFQQESGFDRVADDHGVLVAYPDGFALSWNAGACCGPAKAAKIDDVGFLTQLIEHLIDVGAADPDKVFVAGFSNGGGMAYRLACEGPGRVKGIGVVSASLVIDCAPKHPVSAMIAHGRKDTSVPYDGGGNRDFDDTRPFAPVSKAVTFFRNDAGIARLTADGDCRAGNNKGVRVRFCPHGGGHVWPKTMAADLWDFFSSL